MKTVWCTKYLAAGSETSRGLDNIRLREHQTSALVGQIDTCQSGVMQGCWRVACTENERNVMEALYITMQHQLED